MVYVLQKLYIEECCLLLFNVTVNNFTLSNMWVGLNGGWSVRLSGYNNTVKNVSVFGNGCGGISVEGGDRVRLCIDIIIL